MKLIIEYNYLKIVPETPQDVVWLEEQLGMKKEGNYCKLARQNAFGTETWAYARTYKEEPE